MVDTGARRDAGNMPGCKGGKDAIMHLKKAGGATTENITSRKPHLKKAHLTGIKEVQVIINVKEIHVKVLVRISLIFNLQSKNNIR